MRLLSTGSGPDAGRRAGAVRWGLELERRTSAPSGQLPATVELAGAELLEEPFLVWSDARRARVLGTEALQGLRTYLTLGGTLVVDDADPERGEFVESAREQVLRALPEASPIELPRSHVLHKTYYLLNRPVGRVLGAPTIEAIVQSGIAQVLFLKHDLLGALARSEAGDWIYPVVPGGPVQREHAIRLAVNVAMYVLCSDYKDDQAHAPWLMRRRAPPWP